MAIVKGVLQLQGSLENVTYYTRRGSDQIIARTKQGSLERETGHRSKVCRVSESSTRMEGLC